MRVRLACKVSAAVTILACFSTRILARSFECRGQGWEGGAAIRIHLLGEADSSPDLVRPWPAAGILGPAARTVPPQPAAATGPTGSAAAAPSAAVPAAAPLGQAPEAKAIKTE